LQQHKEQETEALLTAKSSQIASLQVKLSEIEPAFEGERARREQLQQQLEEVEGRLHEVGNEKVCCLLKKNVM
jgi:hypothetical protein